MKEDATVTPEPGAEKEIEIAAGGGGAPDSGDTTKSASDSGSESSRSREGREGREGPHSALTQKLAGILGGGRPGSGLGSRKDSGSSTPARSEALEYLCASFVQSNNNNKADCENKMSIVCHYNPIMDEYNRSLHLIYFYNRKLRIIFLDSRHMFAD